MFQLFLISMMLNVNSAGRTSQAKKIQCVTFHNQNTINSRVKVYYPFHPLNGLELAVVRKSKKGAGAVTVADPKGINLKIPVWMVSPQAAQIELSEKAEISARALLELVHLMALFFKRNHAPPFDLVKLFTFFSFS